MVKKFASCCTFMKRTKIIMGMPVSVEIVDPQVNKKDIKDIFEYFISLDKKFSPYKKASEVSKINYGKILKKDYSLEMKQVLNLSEQTKIETKGYFDVFHNGKFDPSGLVKGWAIHNGSNLLRKKGFANFFVEIGGDIEIQGKNSEGNNWKVGIRNPFNTKEIIKILSLTNCAVATSGTYERGEHIYSLKNKSNKKNVVSLTVIGLNAYEADRFATASFAMGEKGIEFLERQKNLEGYMINKEGIATYTSGFEKYLIS